MQYKFNPGDKVRFTSLDFYDSDYEEDFEYHKDFQLGKTYAVVTAGEDSGCFPYRLEGSRFFVPEEILKPAANLRRK